MAVGIRKHYLSVVRFVPLIGEAITLGKQKEKRTVPAVRFFYVISITTSSGRLKILGTKEDSFARPRLTIIFVSPDS